MIKRPTLIVLDIKNSELKKEKPNDAIEIGKRSTNSFYDKIITSISVPLTLQSFDKKY